jgi:hypothetical protein
LRFHLTPVAMFILQAANTPQMLRDVEHGPLRQGADDVRARGLPQFPVTLDLKTGTELCCILSGITARGISRDARRCRAGTRCERSHYRRQNP